MDYYISFAVFILCLSETKNKNMSNPLSINPEFIHTFKNTLQIYSFYYFLNAANTTWHIQPLIRTKTFFLNVNFKKNELLVSFEIRFTHFLATKILVSVSFCSYS